MTTGIIISVDSPARCGQKVFIKELREALAEVYGGIDVRLIDPNKFYSRSMTEQLGFYLSAKDRAEKIVSSEMVRLEAVSDAYAMDIYLALESGKIVILDSSEIETLALSLMIGNKVLDFRTKGKVINNELTGGIYPDLRIVINATSDYLLKYIDWPKEKYSQSEKNELVSALRTVFYQSATFVRKMKGNESRNWLTLEGSHDIGLIGKMIESKIIPLV